MKPDDAVPPHMQSALDALTRKTDGDRLVPLAHGTILSSASAALARQIEAVVPEGKNGAAVTIVDKDGVRIGLAATYKGIVTISVDVRKGWDKEPPVASLKLKAVW